MPQTCSGGPRFLGASLVTCGANALARDAIRLIEIDAHAAQRPAEQGLSRDGRALTTRDEVRGREDALMNRRERGVTTAHTEIGRTSSIVWINVRPAPRASGLVATRQ